MGVADGENLLDEGVWAPKMGFRCEGLIYPPGQGVGREALYPSSFSLSF